VRWYVISTITCASELSQAILYQLSKLTAAEAVTFPTKELFSHNWKHSSEKKCKLIYII